jgi:hypothetical protein
MAEDRCRHDLLVDQCSICRPRPGDLKIPEPGRRSEGTGFAREVIATVHVDGADFGLLASGGEAYASAPVTVSTIGLSAPKEWTRPRIESCVYPTPRGSLAARC